MPPASVRPASALSISASRDSGPYASAPSALIRSSAAHGTPGRSPDTLGLAGRARSGSRRASGEGLTSSQLGAAPVVRFLRPGPHIAAAELDVLTMDGVLRRIVADLYAPVTLDDSPGLRAQALQQLLPAALRRSGVLSGETAVWVYAGGPEPRRLHLITDGVYRRQTKHGMEWRIHQIPLSRTQVHLLEGAALTSPARTAADLLAGRGCEASRYALDTLIGQLPGRTSSEAKAVSPAKGLSQDRHSDPPVAARHQDGSAEELGPLTAIRHRQDTLRRLMRQTRADPAVVADILSSSESPLRCDTARTTALRRLLAQCTSRRLPTVR